MNAGIPLLFAVKAYEAYQFSFIRLDEAKKLYDEIKKVCGNLKSVSYTHLDVYKRQGQGCQNACGDRRQELCHSPECRLCGSELFQLCF